MDLIIIIIIIIIILFAQVETKHTVKQSV